MAFTGTHRAIRKHSSVPSFPTDPPSRLQSCYVHFICLYHLGATPPPSISGPKSCNGCPFARGERNERKFEHSFENWKGEQTNSHDSCSNCEVYVVVQVLYKTKLCGTRILHCRRYTLKCTPVRQPATLIVAQSHMSSIITNKLLMTMH